MTCNKDLISLHIALSHFTYIRPYVYDRKLIEINSEMCNKNEKSVLTIILYIKYFNNRTTCYTLINYQVI